MAGEIITTIVTAITSFLTGIGTAIVDFFDKTVVTTGPDGETGLTNFAVWALVFLGVTFAFTVVRAILKKVG